MSSALQLERYYFDDLVVCAGEADVPEEAEHNLKTESNLQRHKEDEHRWRLELRIYTDEKDENPPPKYGLGLRVIGFFRDSFDEMEQDQRAHLISVNGSSILYSAAREFLLMVTNRCPHGGYWLPTVSFFKPLPDDQGTEEEAGDSDDGK